MRLIDWVQFLLGVSFIFVGLGIFFIQMLGVFEFRYVLNRMHAAAMGDTLGLASCMFGLMILSGFSFTSVKMALVVIFLWLASPVSSHLISRLEVTTNKHLAEFCELPEDMVCREVDKTKTADLDDEEDAK